MASGVHQALLHGPFTNLDPDDVTQRMDTWYRGVMKAAKTLSGPPQEVCEQLKAGPSF